MGVRQNAITTGPLKGGSTNKELRPQDMESPVGNTSCVPDEEFLDLLRHATLVDADMVAQLQTLVEGVDIDLDAPLNPAEE